MVDNGDAIVLLEGARTPVGTFTGGLARVSATELGVTAARAALERSRVEPEQVDAAFVGNVIQSSRDAVYIARHIALKAGIPETAPALTVNRLCGSGLEAILQAARALRLGESTMVLAGGAENMSMTPHAIRDVRRGQGWGFGRNEVDDILWSALTDTEAGCLIGETVEHLAAEEQITREEADRFAVRSQTCAAQAQQRGRLAAEIVPVEIASRKGRTTRITQDEAIRPNTTMEALAGLPPIYPHIGSICSAGNSSGLNDAAAMLVVTTARRANTLGLKPLGRLVSWGISGIAPRRMGLGPVEACQQALGRAGVSMSEVDVIEINDAFTAQAIAVERALNLDRERINPNGGCLALGHPMGASGTRLALTALYELRERSSRYALTTLSIGGGMGIAALFEAM
ncbi:MAG: acetyl-CoA C-acyltransferase [Myxococcota bacterium]